MNHAETLKNFHQPVSLEMLGEGLYTKNSGDINVYDRRNCQHCSPYRRRDFYKVTLIESTGVLHYADKGIPVNEPMLLFSNPMIPYSWESTQEEQAGYFCIFTEQFLKSRPGTLTAMDSPFFAKGVKPVFKVPPVQQELIRHIFKTMLVEVGSDYPQKYDLLYNYIQILMHEANKLKPAVDYIAPHNAATRITSLFMDLLDRQFPIDESGQIVQLKKAADFAACLSIHVNHLNKAVKEATGKTTSAWISERIIQEAKSLLLHTDWNINEVAYSLGFEYPSYFNNFFRKQTSQTPAAFRN